MSEIEADPSARVAKLSIMATQNRSAAQLRLLAKGGLRRMAMARQLSVPPEGQNSHRPSSACAANPLATPPVPLADALAFAILRIASMGQLPELMLMLLTMRTDRVSALGLQARLGRTRRR